MSKRPTAPEGKRSSSKKTSAKKPSAQKQPVDQEKLEAAETELPEEPRVPGEKIQKVLARAGIGSRREMEKAITNGLVRVNGRLASLGDRIEDTDKLEYSGQVVRGAQKSEQRLRVILYNKPEGQICSRSDPEGRDTVFDNLPRLRNGRWISVGRLDFNTSGLLLLTNDGELANKLMHPSSEIDREYLARIQGDVDNEMLQRLREGVLLDDGMAKFTDVLPSPENKREDGQNHWFYCVVMEGRNREVRRLWESQEVRVSRLKRVRFGNIFIPSHVRVGQWVELSDTEVRELCLTAGLEPPKAQKFSPAISQARKRHDKRLRSVNTALTAKRRGPR